MAKELTTATPEDGSEWGPAMRALNDRQRAFVLALYQVRPGYGANVAAARLAGYGTPTSSPQSMSVIATRLAHDEKVLAAIYEQDQLRIRSSAPGAINSLLGLIGDPTHKDHARAIGMVLDRVHPAESVHHVKVERRDVPAIQDPEKVLARIEALAAKAGIAHLPPPREQPLDVEFKELPEQAPTTAQDWTAI